MKKVLFFIIATFLLSNILSAQSFDYKSNTIIVKINPELTSIFFKSDFVSKMSSVYGQFDVSQEFPDAEKPIKDFDKYGRKCVDITNIYRIVFRNSVNVYDVVAYLKKSKDVEYAEPLYNVYLLDFPSDPLLLPENVNADGAYQYWAENIRAFDAWDISQGDTSVVIGISDTGTGLTHNDLADNLKINYNDVPDGIDNDGDGYVDNYKGWNFASDNDNAQVPSAGGSREHGAYVSGIASAVVNNGIGVAGAGYKCKFVPLRIADDEGSLVNTYQSIVYAANHHFDVVNCSWGSTVYQQMAQDVVWYATINNDLLIVAAAGNEGIEGKFYPASYENVLSVAATDKNDAKWSGSSFSTSVDVSAPGTMFVSTSENGYATMWGGTSFASPIVAGCAGIIRNFYPEYNALQITEIIRASADNIDTLSNLIPDSVMHVDSTFVEFIDSISIDSVWNEETETYIYDTTHHEVYYGQYDYDTTYTDASYRDYFNSDYASMLGSGRMNLYNALTLSDDKKYSTLFCEKISDRYDTILDLTGLITNYLNYRTDLQMYVSTTSEYITFADSVISFADMQTMQSDSAVIRMYVSSEAPKEFSVKLKLTFVSAECATEQVISVLVNGGFVDIYAGDMRLSVAGNGRLGYVDLYSEVGRGFTLNNYELIADCGVISGISNEEIYCSVRQLSDFSVVEYPHLITDTLAETHAFARMLDTADYNSHNLEYIINAYADNLNYIILDYSLVNSSYWSVEDFYFGLFADFDLEEPTCNKSVFDENGQFMYCMYDSLHTLYAGMKLLSGQSVKNYSVLNERGGDGYVDISDGLSDNEQFRMISNNSVAEDVGDVVQFTGAGPFDINYNDTVSVAIALFAANSYAEMCEAVEEAVEKYRYLKGEQEQEDDIQSVELANFNIYPNPVNDILTIDFQQDKYEVKIYNTIGVCVYSGENISSLNVENFNAGIYNVTIIYDGGVKCGKFVKS